MLITGGRGYYPYTTVSQYNEAGHVRDLPPLRGEGRYLHGCTFYNNDEGTKVEIDINYNYCPIMIFQTYLVTGGFSGSARDVRLSSTELLVETASAWVYTGRLPSPRNGLRGANIDNRVLMTGN